jgi:putative transposase
MPGQIPYASHPVGRVFGSQPLIGLGPISLTDHQTECLRPSFSLSQPGRVEALAFQATASASAPPVSWGMPEYRRGAHTIFEIHLHLVWVTKYRRPALAGDVAVRVRDLIRDICGQHEVKIMKGHVAKDHVHLFLSIPPQVTISRLLQWLKGKPPTIYWRNSRT